MTRAALSRLDDALARAERVGLTVLTVSMGGLVFLDVLHRVATRPEGPLARLAGSEAGGTALALAVWAVLATLAFRTRGASPRAAALRGLAAAAALGAAVALFVEALPNGLVWSQTLALALMLWLGFAGASLAAKEGRHLGIDAWKRAWPPHLHPLAVTIGAGVTAAFCLFLAVLSAGSIAGHFGDWQATQHAGGTLVGLPVPKWLAFLALPYGFAAIAFRFALAGWDAQRGSVKEEESEYDQAMRQLGMKREEGGP